MSRSCGGDTGLPYPGTECVTDLCHSPAGSDPVTLNRACRRSPWEDKAEALTGTRTEKLPFIQVSRFKGKCSRESYRASRHTAEMQCKTYRIRDTAERVCLPPPSPALGVGGHCQGPLRIPSWKQWGPQNAILSADGLCWLFPPLLIYS